MLFVKIYSVAFLSCEFLWIRQTKVDEFIKLVTVTEKAEKLENTEFVPIVKWI